MDKTAALMRELSYQFNDESLLILALTHRSKGSKNYERLEFLGDSILGFVVAHWLFDEFEDIGEGRLSRMRSTIVRKETLASVARDMNLSNYLILGEGELKSGGFNRDSILSDTVESIIGAIFLDSDLDSAKEFIISKLQSYLEQLSPETNFKDAKSLLQERMQKMSFALPKYTIINTTGEQHQQEFTIDCNLEDLNMSQQATAASRRIAEQKAAECLLELLDNEK